MSRPVRIGIMTFASLLLLALLAVIAGISILRSDWFFQRIRQAPVTQIEKHIVNNSQIGETTRSLMAAYAGSVATECD